MSIEAEYRVREGYFFSLFLPDDSDFGFSSFLDSDFDSDLASVLDSDFELESDDADAPDDFLA